MWLSRNPLTTQLGRLYSSKYTDTILPHGANLASGVRVVYGGSQPSAAGHRATSSSAQSRFLSSVASESSRRLPLVRRSSSWKMSITCCRTEFVFRTTIGPTGLPRGTNTSGKCLRSVRRSPLAEDRDANGEKKSRYELLRHEILCRSGRPLNYARVIDKVREFSGDAPRNLRQVRATTHPRRRSRWVTEYGRAVAEHQTHPLWRATAVVALVTTVLMGVGGVAVVATGTLVSEFRAPFLASVGVFSILIGLLFLFSLSVVSDRRTVYW